MDAGRELDALVAGKVFGFTGIGYYGPNKKHGSHLDYDLYATAEEAKVAFVKFWDRYDPIEDQPELCRMEPGHGHVFVPDYSTDIAAAWEVVEKFGLWVIHQPDAFPPYRWVVCREEPTRGGVHIDPDGFIDGEIDCVTFAPTAPLAICLAALAVLGVEVSGTSSQEPG